MSAPVPSSSSSLEGSRRFSVAPMMDWTDRHCRAFHRFLSREALLFTEMVTAQAVVFGERARLLDFDANEHPVALQIGGADPALLAEATRIGADWGYDEINLNVGCPSDRVQSGKFGACLMAEPELVASCVDAMKRATDRPVTVKCRIGIDDQDSEADLARFAAIVVEAGVDALYVHARKAWLQGLSPKENRDIPPLDYERVYRLKAALGAMPVAINGGIATLDAAQEHLAHVDGVMLGRAAYHDPMLLSAVDQRIFGSGRAAPGLDDVRDFLMAYAEAQLASGVRLNQITRHVLGLVNGLPGARRFRQILSVDACRPGAGPAVIAAAFAALLPDALEAAE